MNKESASHQPHRNLTKRVVWASAAVLGGVGVIFGLIVLHPENSAPPVRFTVDAPKDGSLFGRPSVSPDGRSVLFAVAGPTSQSPVWWLYNVASRTSRAVRGTEDTTAVHWSFDSRSILLSRANVFWTMDIGTSSPQRLPVVGAYSSWRAEGIVSGGREGLRWFRPDGSGLRWIKRRDENKGTAYSYPRLIPGGRWFVYNAAESGGFSVRFASLDGKADSEILKAEHPAIYTGPGYLLTRRGDTLTAQAIDPKSGKLRGAPAPIASPIGISTGQIDLLGSFSASDNGVLVFRSGIQQAPKSFTIILNWPSLLKKK